MERRWTVYECECGCIHDFTACPQCDRMQEGRVEVIPAVSFDRLKEAGTKVAELLDRYSYMVNVEAGEEQEAEIERAVAVWRAALAGEENDGA